jgi:predicted ATPase
MHSYLHLISPRWAQTSAAWPSYRGAETSHQTLRAALNWSFESLSHDEQTILARLSVFRSPFDIEAAVAVVADDTISRANASTGLLI